jgi:hypothetical protein
MLFGRFLKKDIGPRIDEETDIGRIGTQALVALLRHSLRQNGDSSRNISSLMSNVRLASPPGRGWLTR